MMSAVREYQDRAGGSFTALAFAAAAAGDGRDAIAGAASLPRPALAGQPAVPGAPDADGTGQSLAAALAGLAGLLAARLAEAAEAAAAPEDRTACQVAAWQAREIQRLLAGGQP
jgi:hypothetical protein